MVGGLNLNADEDEDDELGWDEEEDEPASSDGAAIAAPVSAMAGAAPADDVDQALALPSTTPPPAPDVRTSSNDSMVLLTAADGHADPSFAAGEPGLREQMRIAEVQSVKARSEEAGFYFRNV